MKDKEQERTLRHPVRRDIVDYVRRHPGAHVGELDQAMEAGWGALQHHIRVLERARLLAEETDGARRRFFVPGSIDPAARRRVALLRNPSLRRVFDAIAAEPDIHQTRLADVLGLSRSATRKHLVRLVDEGLVEAHNDGRRRCYRTTYA